MGKPKAGMKGKGNAGKEATTAMNKIRRQRKHLRTHPHDKGQSSPRYAPTNLLVKCAICGKQEHIRHMVQRLVDDKPFITCIACDKAKQPHFSNTIPAIPASFRNKLPSNKKD